VGEVVFCFDGDRAGRAAAWRALENSLPEVREGRQLRFLFLPDGHDPDSLVGDEGAEAFEARMAQALPLADYLVAELRSRAAPEGVDGRARFVELARPLLRRIPSEVYRELLLGQLSEVVGLPAARLGELLAHGEAAAPERIARQGPPRRDAPVPLLGRGNLVRQAVSLVVHFPTAAARVRAPAELDAVDRPGVPLLARLLAELRDEPAQSTGVLLERWRERSEHGSLSRLAALECLVADEQAAAVELDSALQRLVSEFGPAARLRELNQMMQDKALNEQEIAELRELLRERARRTGEKP
jgi:DNA primase